MFWPSRNIADISDMLTLSYRQYRRYVYILVHSYHSYYLRFSDISAKICAKWGYQGTKKMTYSYKSGIRVKVLLALVPCPGCANKDSKPFRTGSDHRDNCAAASPAWKPRESQCATLTMTNSEFANLKKLQGKKIKNVGGVPLWHFQVDVWVQLLAKRHLPKTLRQINICHNVVEAWASVLAR